ncbi:hypothetical protein VYU27_001924 [Nannochloropsis oceanica]
MTASTMTTMRRRSENLAPLFSIRTGGAGTPGMDDDKTGYGPELIQDPDASMSPEEWEAKYGEEVDTMVLYDEKDLERRRIDAIRVAKYMDVMGAAKSGEPHPRIAMAAKAHKVKEVKRLTHGMLYRRLGKSDLIVSEVALGTMTWGEQVTEEQAHAQLNMAVDEYGVNFIDTAELYPVPADPDTHGLSEKIVGSWLKKRKRSDVIIATKVTGYSDVLTWLRKDGGPVRLTAAQINEAVEGSLKRLGTDYIDLLQLHWPDRYLNLFGVDLYDRSREREDFVSFEEQLTALSKLIKDGKIRHIGLSNESPYGVMKFLETARVLGMEEVVSVQNCYNLLYRNEMDMGLSEISSPAHEDLGILCYSPLAGGVLSGKYMFKGRASEARLNRFPGYMARYRTLQSQDCVFEYKEIASRYGLSMGQLALGWVYSRPFVTSTIIGATSVDQLRENLDALNTPIFSQVVHDLSEVFMRYRDPSRTFARVLDDGDTGTDERVR